MVIHNINTAQQKRDHGANTKLRIVKVRYTGRTVGKMHEKKRTTNPNESFKAQIWRRATKHLPVGKQTLDTEVAMAVLEFNKGPNGFISILEHLNIVSGYHNNTYNSINPQTM